jgi:hypothetical protein
VVLLLLSLLVAIVYPKILVIFNFLGGVCASCFVLLLPTALGIHMSDKPATHWSNVAKMTGAVLLSLMGWMSVVFSFA